MSTLLSSPTTKAGRTQRIVLDLFEEHRQVGALPTNGRFVFYELEQRELAVKPQPDDRRPNRKRSIGWPPGQQDITDAITRIRERGVIPWSWVTDNERTLTVWSYEATVADYMRERLDEATINRWGEELPPLVICESKATAGVLEAAVSNYVCPITGTKGQTRGFLITVVAPILRGNTRRVLYLGDLDRSGDDIESNTRRVLERGAGREIDWKRLGVTEEQAEARAITPIWKVDGRDGKGHWATEVESLGQAGVVELVQEALDALLPEPLEDVQKREREQRQAIAELLATWA